MHFYIHIPFCRKKCLYCKFALTPIFDEVKKRRYIAYLKHEIQTYFASFDEKEQSIDTIYFGGGTPSILSLSEAREILECFPIGEVIPEITFESNPEDITESYVRGLFSLGINRLSLGIQSLNDQTLREVHRSDRTSIFSALISLQSAIQYFPAPTPSVNIDMMLGLPYSTPGETLVYIKELHTNFPFLTHTSVYMLEAEKYPSNWKSISMSYDQICTEFGDIIEYFENKKWHHYELSNFSKSGYESVHNQSYWDHSEYRGFGLSASSFLDGQRFVNANSFVGYYRGEIDDQECLTEGEREREKLMFGLRTQGYVLKPGFLDEKKIDECINQGLLEKSQNRILPTKTGIFLLDHIMTELLGE